MKLLIFGATGSVGLQLVQQSLQQGHSVTAFTRHPDKLTAMAHERLSVVKGDVLTPSDVYRAMTGHDCVLCAIGDGNKGAVREAGTRNIIRGMKEAGITRFICETTLGLGDSKGNLNLLWKVMFGTFLRKAFNDHIKQENLVFNSGLDFTIVRPGAFTNGPVTGTYKVGFSGNERGLSLKISRGDVAHFMLGQATAPGPFNPAVSISN